MTVTIIEEMDNAKLDQCQQLLESLVASSVSIETALVASRDGILLAGVGKDDQLDLMAAISASLMSLADALSSRSQKGLSKKVLSESDDSSLVVLHAGELVLTVIGELNMNMGLVLTESKGLALKIVDIFQE